MPHAACLKRRLYKLDDFMNFLLLLSADERRFTQTRLQRAGENNNNFFSGPSDFRRYETGFICDEARFGLCKKSRHKDTKTPIFLCALVPPWQYPRLYSGIRRQALGIRR